MLAWTCTIHMVQGLTLPNLAISLQLDKQTTFGAGQFYVAVNCATALSKVSLIVGLKSDMIQASASALLEYYRLRRYSNFFSAFENDTKIILALLNIRGLVNNLDNFLADVNIQSVPVVCLTDTNLRNSHNNRQLIIRNKMPDFDIIFSNSSDIYKSLALVFKKDMFACQDSVLPDGFLFAKLLSF